MYKTWEPSITFFVGFWRNLAQKVGMIPETILEFSKFQVWKKKKRKKSATMVSRWIKFLISNGLKLSKHTFPHFKNSVKTDNCFDRSCHVFHLLWQILGYRVLL